MLKLVSISLNKFTESIVINYLKDGISKDIILSDKELSIISEIPIGNPQEPKAPPIIKSEFHGISKIKDKEVFNKTLSLYCKEYDKSINSEDILSYIYSLADIIIDSYEKGMSINDIHSDIEKLKKSKV